jgi:hypothetical protein
LQKHNPYRQDYAPSKLQQKAAKKQFDPFWECCYIQRVNGNLNLLLSSALLCRAAVGL